MAEYNAPGVYMESVKNTSKSITGNSSDTFGFVGVTPRGSIDGPIYVTSWNNFIEKCAGGLSSPFMADHDLSYALYGFFQNGGTKAYISRVVNKTTAKKAKATNEGETLSFEAKDEGEWGNQLTVSIRANTLEADQFDLVVNLGKNNTVEVLTGLSNDSTKYNYAFDVINGQSSYVTLPDEAKSTLAVTDTPLELTGGKSGVDNLTDLDYGEGITRLKQVDELGFICVPGINTDTTIANLKAFVEGKNQYTFALIDMPKSVMTKEAAIEFRKKVQSDSMAVVEPYGYVTDPLSASGRLRLVPPTGHWCGYEAKNIQTNGIQKAPAGTEATISGFVSLAVNYTADDLEQLNPAGIITLINKKNYGIVIWGCRSCSSDPDYKYVTDKLVDNYIDGSIYDGTQWAVFEENDEDLWDNLTTTVTEFLETCRQRGIIKGNTSATSYYVNCNEDINTEAMQKAGKVICEYGYAKKKPAEFVIHRVDHQMSSGDTSTEA